MSPRLNLLPCTPSFQQTGTSAALALLILRPGKSYRTVWLRLARRFCLLMDISLTVIPVVQAGEYAVSASNNRRRFN